MTKAAGARSDVPFLVLAAALTAIMPMSFDFYLPAFPDIAQQFDASVSSVQLTLSAALIGVAIGQLLYGPLVDRFGRRGPAIAGLSLLIVASIACAFAPSLPVLIALRFLQALGGSGAVVGARAMTRDRFSGPDLARAFSFIFLVFGVAPVLAPSLGALMLMWTSWRGLFIFLAVFGVLCLVGIVKATETHPPERRTDHGLAESLRAYRDVLRNPVFVWSTITGMFVGAGLFAFISVAPAALIDAYGMSTGNFAIVFGLVSLSLFIVSMLNAKLVRRFEIRRLIVMACGVQFAGTLLLIVVAGTSAPWWLYTIVLVIPVSCIGLLVPNTQASALEPFPHAAGTAAAFSGMAQMLGGAAAAAVLSASAMFPPMTLAIGFAVAAFLSLLSAVVLRRSFAHAHALPAA